MGNNFNTGFLSGLVSGGVGTYLRMKDSERADARDQRDQDRADRESEREKRLSAALQEANGELLGSNGTVAPQLGAMAAALPVGQLAPTENLAANPTAATDPAAAIGTAPSQAESPVGRAISAAAKPADLTKDTAQRAALKIALASRDAAAIERISMQMAADRQNKKDMADVQEVISNPVGDKAKALQGLFTSNMPGATLAVDSKTGVWTAQMPNPDGSMHTAAYSPAQLGQFQLAMNQLQRGDVNALTTLANVDKSLASAALARWQMQHQLASLNNTAAATRANIANQGVNQLVALDGNRRANEAAPLQNAQTAASTAATIGGEQRAQQMAPIQQAAGLAGVTHTQQTTADMQRKAAIEAAVPAARAGLAQQQGMTPAQVEAARVGVIDPTGQKQPWKFEGSEISNSLGEAAVDPRTKQPIMDPMTGKQVVNRNPQREQRFAQYMLDNKMRDTNEALPKFLAQESRRAVAEKLSKVPPGAVDMLRKNPKMAAQFDAASQKAGWGVTAADVLNTK